MAYPTGSRGGNFVSRVKTIDRPNSYTSLYKTVNNEIYEPTGSNTNTAFLVSGSAGHYLLRGADGGATIAAGLTVGTLYPFGLSYVSCSTAASVHLLR